MVLDHAYIEGNSECPSLGFSSKSILQCKVCETCACSDLFIVIGHFLWNLRSIYCKVLVSQAYCQNESEFQKLIKSGLLVFSPIITVSAILDLNFGRVPPSLAFEGMEDPTLSSDSFEHWSLISIHQKMNHFLSFPFFCRCQDRTYYLDLQHWLSIVH